MWLALPAGILSSSALGFVWTNYLELPSEELVGQYLSAVRLTCLSSCVLLAAEPFYVVGQAHLRVKFRTAVDTAYLVLQAALQCAVVVAWPGEFVLYGACASLLNSSVYLLAHVWYFRREVARRREKEEDEIKCLTSLRDFFPTFSPSFSVDEPRFRLSLSFFQQGFFKQLLTEGEKYMFTWFSLLSLPEQGVYDVVANLGSIPARLFFSKLEESAHLYFSHTVTRGDGADMKKEREPSRHLHVLLKGLVLLGFVVLAFGFSYSHLLLHLYGGDLLSSGVGPSLLRAHCVYVIFLAINGISECYAFAVMTASEVAAYNYRMGWMTAAFLLSTWAMAKVLGPVGFTAANVFNFSMRIHHNFGVIRRRHLEGEVKPLEGLLPSGRTMVALAVAFVLCQWSERSVYSTELRDSFLHLVIGGIVFLATCATIVISEPYIYDAVKRKLKRD